MSIIATNLAAQAPVLEETARHMAEAGLSCGSVLSDFAADAARSLARYNETHPAAVPGQEVPFTFGRTGKDVQELEKALDLIFMYPGTPVFEEFEKTYGYREMRRMQGTLYDFCFTLKRYLGI